MAIVENKTVFARNLRHYMEEKNVRQKDIAIVAKVSSGTICDWLSGRTYPRMDKVQRIAEFFHIEKSDLIEEHSLENQYYVSRVSKDLYKELTNDPEAAIIYQDIKKLSPANREIVKALIKSLGEK